MGLTVCPYKGMNVHKDQAFLFAVLLLVWISCLGTASVAQDNRGTGKVAVDLSSQSVSSALVVQSNTQEAVSFGFEQLLPQWKKTVQGLQASERFFLDIPGFVSAGSPGSASVPHQGGWIVVPPGKSPVLHIKNEKWMSAGGRPLAVVPIPVRVGSIEADDASFSEITILPTEDIPEDLPYPPAIMADFSKRTLGHSGSAVQLGDVVWWRGRRIVPYTIIPVRYDSGAMATEVLEAGAWEVRFAADKSVLDRAIPAHHKQKITNRLDDNFSAGFLNGSMLATMPTEAALRGMDLRSNKVSEPLEKMRGQKSGTLKGAEVKIPVSSSRLFRVSYATLLENDLLPAGVTLEESEIRVYQRRYMEELDDGSGQAPYAEIEVPLHMVGEGDAFDGDDFFIFYGLRCRDDRAFTMEIDGNTVSFPGSGDPFENNSSSNIYWLAFSVPDVGENWARMENTSLPAASSTALSSYSRSVHQEEAVAYRDFMPNQTSDRITNNRAWDSSTNILISPLYSPDPAGSDVAVKISMAGNTTDLKTIGFSFETDDLAPVEIGSFSVYSRNEVYYHSTVPISAIVGESTTLIATGETVGTPWMNVYINYVELTYDALYQVTANHLQFHGDGTGPQPMKVTGFENEGMGVIELTDPRRPVFITLDASNIVTDGETVTLSIQPEQGQEQRSFFAHGDMLGNGIGNFAYWLTELADESVNPTEVNGGSPDLIVVTPEEFRSGIEPWITHRKARSGGNLEVHTVLAQDLYDWYSGGMHNAWAIKRFASHAISQWGTYAMQLVGDGNENVRELGVNAGGRPFARDWIPTHYHTQHTGYPPELLGSDKWYATSQYTVNYPFDNFPDLVRAPWEILVGRFPCNNPEDLANIIAKIQVVENPQPEQTWRKRAVFIADDAWSNGWGVEGMYSLSYKPSEEYFATSARDSLGAWWGSGTGVAMVPDTLDLATWLDPLGEGNDGPPRSLSLFKGYTKDYAYPPLLNSLNAGGLVAHYQGHGSGYVLSSEHWFKDQIAGTPVLNVSDLSNNNRPWVFFGMGCHIADWCRDTSILGTYYKEPSLSEKFLVRASSGASACYASSGYEYISTNLIFGETIFRIWAKNPPVSRGASGTMNDRSRWVLGELLWAGEAEMMAWGAYYANTREAVAQFTLLGDPLMVLDGGEPEITAVLQGTSEELSGSVDLVALDSSNKRTITIEARDEAGIDRIELVDSDGNYLSDYVISETYPVGASSHQVVTYELEIDILPYDHNIVVKVYDTGASLPGDRHYELQLNMHQDGEFISSGEIVDPETFIFREGEPLDFQGIVRSSAFLDEEMDISLTGKHLTITNEAFTFDKANGMAFSFTAEENGETDEARAVILSIDGYTTEFVLMAEAGALVKPAITGVYSYPNPLHDTTRFVFESNSAGGKGKIRIFSMAGRQVASLPFTFAGGGDGGVVPWNGKDNEGDELGNGTYLYRLEMDTSAGQLVSEMQRLVIMR